MTSNGGQQKRYFGLNRRPKWYQNRSWGYPRGGFENQVEKRTPKGGKWVSLQVDIFDQKSKKAKKKMNTAIGHCPGALQERKKNDF